jgi:hypothetical protein
VVASVGVPNLSNLHMGVVAAAAALAAAASVAVVAGAVSGVASTAVVVASVEEADVVLAVGEEEGSETEVDLETEVAAVSEGAVAVASEEAGMTLDHREVEVATGSCSAK